MVGGREHLVGLQRAAESLSRAAPHDRHHLIQRANRAWYEDIETRLLQSRENLIRDVLRQCLLDGARFGKATAELGLNSDRHHAGDLDAGAAQLGANCLTHADDIVLRPAVGGTVGVTGLAGCRGDVDDVAVTARDHRRDCQAAAVIDAVDVDVDHPLRRRHVLVEVRAKLHDSGVVDDHVDRAHLLLNGRDKSGERVKVGDVKLQADRAGADLLGGLCGERAVEVADRDLHPGARQRLRRALADSARSTGDRNDLSYEIAFLLSHLLLLRTQLGSTPKLPEARSRRH
ncbi:unannotated protein [freshwater metagenome]|uniref:Unannotated protein n=1 Tax=freshwater metagenome TaxID=449393 RepID=A0A6J5ZYW5_9ZZZZ